MPVDPDDLLGDLSLVRKGRGFTVDRLRAVGTLRSCLGGGDGEEAYPQIRERLLSAIHSLHDGDADILLAAFRLTDDTKSLTTLKSRRAYFGTLIGRSVETVANREVAALVALRNQLVSGWYPGSPTPLRFPNLHNGVLNEEVSIRVDVCEGVWMQTHERYRFIAAFDEADYLVVANSFLCHAVTAGDFRVQSQHNSDRGESTHTFWAASPMRRGRRYELSYMLTPRPLAPPTASRIVETARAFHAPTLYASMAVHFGAEGPKRVWSFTGVAPFNQAGKTAQGNFVPSVTAGIARAEWRDLHGGLMSGMAWQW